MAFHVTRRDEQRWTDDQDLPGLRVATLVGALEGSVHPACGTWLPQNAEPSARQFGAQTQQQKHSMADERPGSLVGYRAFAARRHPGEPTDQRTHLPRGASLRRGIISVAR